MKTTALALLSIGLAATLHADVSPSLLEVRSSLLEYVKTQFHYGVVAESDSAATSAGSELKVLKLEPVVVSAPRDRGAPVDIIVDRPRRWTEDTRFSLRDGGTFLMYRDMIFTSELKLKWRPGMGMEIARISW